MASHNHQRLSLRLSAILLIPLCVYLGWVALAWGIADRYANPAERMLTEWSKGKPITPEDLGTAVSFTRSAIDWAPDNPWYQDQLASILLIRLIREQDVESGKLAKEHLLHSRAIRPAWPMNWALYIRIKYELSEIDEDLFSAITTATRIGQWDPAAQMAVTEAGVAYFDVLPPDVQIVVLENTKRAIASRINGIPGQAIRLISNQGTHIDYAFVDGMLRYLVNEPWPLQAQNQYAYLAMMWWGYLHPQDRLLVGVKVAEALAASRGGELIRTIEELGRLDDICPMLPRSQRFTRVCSRTFRRALR